MQALKNPIKNPSLFSPWVERFLVAVVIFSVGVYVLEVEYGGSAHSLEGHPFWLWTERLVAAVLSLEYIARWRKEGMSYPKSNMGIIDLWSVLPFWLGFLVPVAWLGLVRSMRVLRLLKFYRYSRAMRVFVHALLVSRRHLTGMFLIVFILVLFGAVGIREIERDAQPEVFGSLFNSIWWTIVTLMSVGYGDAVPITPPGKGFAQVVMVLGVGLTARPSSASWAAMCLPRYVNWRRMLTNKTNRLVYE